MLQYDGVVPSTLEQKPRLVVSRRIPLLIPEDTLSGWLNLKRCLAKEPDWLIVRCPVSDALSQCARLKPCTLVIDQARFEQIDPQRFLQAADLGRAISTLVRIIRDDPGSLKQLLRLGCMGFVTEQTPAAELRNAILAVSGGALWASARVVADFTRELLASPNTSNLTPRETQVLQLIGRGYSNREISQELFISRETVRWHIRTLYAKIGVKNREEAAQFGGSNKEASGPVAVLGSPC